MPNMGKVAVIGAGVVGLSSAVRIQRELPGIEITLIAENFFEATTSNGAAGIFLPGFEPGLPDSTVRKWVTDSFKHYDSILHSQDARDAGVSMVTGYEFHKDKPRQPGVIDDIVYNVRPCSKRELALFPIPSDLSYGNVITTLMVECKWYLPYLFNIFKTNGGKVIKQRIDSFEELCGKFDAIVNATGLGSRHLAYDKHLAPLRGQLVRIIAPWVKTFIHIGSNKTMIYPGRDEVIIGGTRQLNENSQFSQNDKDDILRKAYEIMPSLKTAEVQRSWVGLRPFRNKIRIEKEIITCRGGGKVQVVHNYGHGANGVALSWGSSGDVIPLVQSCLNKSHL